MDVWIEDVEALRVENLEQDLSAFLKGAPLLRQRRDLRSSFRYFGREFYRLGVRIRAYARLGWSQAILTYACLSIGALACAALCWAIGLCFQTLLFDEPDDVTNHAEIARM